MHNLNLGINMWFDCNAHCEHCYINKAPELYRMKPMSEDTKERLIQACRRWTAAHGRYTNANAYILGGEPMLAPIKVLGLMQSLRDAVPNIGLHLCTNGTGLDSTSLVAFKSLNVTMQVSVNDLSLEEFDKCMEKVETYKISQRPLVTLTELNLHRLPQIMEIVSKHTSTCMWHQEFGKTDKSYIDLYHRALVGTLTQMLAKDIKIDPNFMWEHLYLGWTKKTGFDHSCLRHGYLIDPDGTVSWCLVAKHYDGKSLGNLHDEEFDFDKLGTIKDHPEYEIDLACLDCSVQAVCGNGCPYQKAYIGPNRADMCMARREIVPLLLEIKNKWQKTEG